MMHHNIELDLAHDFVEKTNKNIYLTGKAGTGKTTFLHDIKNSTFKRAIVVAPTGVAAINAGGVTIHSFFQLPFGPILPDQLFSPNNLHKKQVKFQKFNKRKINMIRSLDLLIIDEISMVRADLLDGIDQVLRRYKNPNQVFGGTQLLMIGDLQQLAPVVKNDEWDILRPYYETAFFFSSRAFKKSDAIGIELKHIYRQENQNFINVLNQIRNSRLDDHHLQLLNDRFDPNFAPKAEDNYITLTTHNRRADQINQKKIKQLSSKTRTFKAIIDGDFPEYNYPNEENLELKVGAQVMFIKNDSSPDKKYFNGKIGVITAMDRDGVSVSCPGDEEEIWTEKESWHHIKYSLDKQNEIKEDMVGSYTQIPLRLAWAITIHKSQGLTFDKAIIDAEASFAHGQTYVALSRCRTLEGIVLKSKINRHGIIQDNRVIAFSEDVESKQPSEKDLKTGQKEYQLHLLKELFDLKALDYRLHRAQKIHYNSGGSLMGHLNAPLKQMKEEGCQALLKVSNSFLHQLKSMSSEMHELESSEAIQERIRKAVEYYLNQIENNLTTPLSQLTFTSDNKAILKDFNEEMEEFKSLLAQKIYCLKACKNGFKTQSYLHARAQSIFQNIKIEKEVTKKEISTEGLSENPELFKRLRQYRHQMAEENNVKHFQVFSQKTLFDICEKLPTHNWALNEVHGIGKKKIERYGEDIIEIVRQYCIEIGKEFDMESPSKTAMEKLQKAPKKNTKEISIELFKEGLSIAEIAQKRALTTGTITGHLLHKIGENGIEFTDIIPEAELIKLEESIRAISFNSLSDLYQKLDKKYDYDILKVVLKKISKNTINRLTNN